MGYIKKKIIMKKKELISEISRAGEYFSRFFYLFSIDLVTKIDKK